MDTKQAEAAQRVQAAHDHMTITVPAEELKKREQVFDRKNRSWRFTFKTPEGEERTFEFTLDADFFSTSIAMLSKKYKRPLVFVSGCIIRDDGTKGEILFNTKVEVPNFWQDRDPHTIFTKEDACALIQSAIRDVNEEIIRRHAGDWLMKEHKRSGSLEFNLTVN